MPAIGARPAFGLTLLPSFDLPWPAAPANGERTVRLERSDRAGLAAVWSGTESGPTWDTLFPGGRRVTVERGRAGDQLVRHGERDAFWIAPRADRVLCVPADADDPSWLRFMLDTVLWWVALGNGMHVLHAGTVELDGGAVGVISRSGGGKSTLVGELLRGGARLFADDVLAIGPAPDLVAHPGPPLMNVAADRPELQRLGRVLARLREGDEEAWMAVDGAATEPRPLRALFLYTRGPGLELEAEPLAATVLDLMPHAWAVPDDRGAAQQRFQLLADVAQRVPIYALTADLAAHPRAIAEVLNKAIADGPTFGVAQP